MIINVNRKLLTLLSVKFHFKYVVSVHPSDDGLVWGWFFANKSFINKWGKSVYQGRRAFKLWFCIVTWGNKLTGKENP